MFMFHSKRTKLIKQLLKDRRKRPPPCTCAAHSDDSGAAWVVVPGPAVAAAAQMVQQLHAIMEKRLKIGQLEILWATVRSLGRQHSGCVLMPRDGDPHVLFCQFYRAWAGVAHASELRRLPTCRTSADPVYTCVNPYHWSRLLQPETPPPPYSTCTLDRLKPEDRAPSEAPIVFRDSFMGSLTTSGEADMRIPHEWCKLAYWEMAQRVGPLLPVDTNCLNIFCDANGSAVAPAEGLCLHTLAKTWAPTDPGTLRYPNNGVEYCGPPDTEATRDMVVGTRSRIGLGVTLSREDNRIWLYNRSEYPVFVHSLELNECSPHCNPSLTNNAHPIRLHAGYCMCVYETTAVHRQHPHQYSSPVGPVDPHSIRISFGKGWGTHGRYIRRQITYCPCWLEILLAPCR